MLPVKVQGRFPSCSTASHIGVKVSNVTVDWRGVRIRLDHDIHPDYWQEITIDVDTMQEWCGRSADCLLAIAQDDPEYQEMMAHNVKMVQEWLERRQEPAVILHVQPLKDHGQR